MSRVNTALVALCLIGAVLGFVLGEPVVGTSLLVGGLIGGGGAIAARRGTSGDLERLNALEWADERDRTAGVKGLAVVGAVALVLGIVQLAIVAIAGVEQTARFMAVGMFLALAASWFFANWYFVRRG
ncbi:hypothetical protein DY023_00700 [Microbacterium bovistercoris]|uniref:DUF2178 domain-containing protein n=2 Tax=Microbacterium bovistercoris TaxID=2293570 RepID=A0A371NZW8_9MICO|nr:hypothetical protein DY023_00700 [Microbacterium bovistercoris]